MRNPKIKLFRDSSGRIKELLSKIESTSYKECPLDFFILLARYKFAARLITMNDRVLDAGCGQGIGSVFLSTFAHSVVGVDVDKKLVDYCGEAYKEIENLSFLIMDLRKVRGPKNNQFDVIVCLDVIEHFTYKDAEKVIKNIWSLIREGGFAVIGTPNKFSRKFASPRRKAVHILEYDYNSFKSLLEKQFKRVFIFSMTDEVVSLSFPKLAWYLVALCIK